MGNILRSKGLVSFIVVSTFVNVTVLADQDGARRVYGPIATWDGDPATTMRITWVEGMPISGGAVVKTSPLWRKGPAGFGYGDDDDQTVIEDMKDKFQRLYIRHEFELDEVDFDEDAELRIRYDDGFIAYLNGKEFARKEIRKGRGKRATDIGSHDAGDEYTVVEIANWKSLARAGRNILAIEGHNNNVSSSDFTLDPYLTVAGTERIKKNAHWDYLAGRDPRSIWTHRGFIPSKDGVRKQKTRASIPRLDFTDVVYFREVGSGEWSTATGSHQPFGDTADVVRTVFIDGLQAATDYEFVIGTPPSRGSEPLRFRTAPNQPGERMTFVTGGDMSASLIAQKMNRLVGRLDPMFAMLGGDLAYANGKDLHAWHEWLDAWRENAVTRDGRIVPMVVGIGNHEMGSELSADRAKQLGVPTDSQFFFSLFKLPTGKTNYALDFGDFLAVVMLDSNHSQKVAGDQTEWLETALQERGDFPFLFVCYHRPTFGTAKDPEQDIRKYWVPLFERYSPTVVFENDHHTLKRTHRIRDGQVDPTGVLYLGDGAWGVKTRDVPRRGEKWYLAKAAKQNHLWLVTIEGAEVLCQALDENGRVLDRVRIIEEVRGSNR